MKIKQTPPATIYLIYKRRKTWLKDDWCYAKEIFPCESLALANRYAKELANKNELNGDNWVFKVVRYRKG